MDCLPVELVHKILLLAVDGDIQMYDTLRLVCKRWQKTLVPRQSILWLVEKFPKKPWNWDRITMNGSVTLENILADPKRPWNWNMISANPNVKILDWNKHPEIPKNWKYMSRNPSLRLQDVLDHPEGDWDWFQLGISSQIQNDRRTLGDMHHELPWKYCISGAEDVVHDINYLRNQFEIGWDEEFMEEEWSHVEVTMKEIDLNPQIPWNWYWLAASRLISVEEALGHPFMKESYTISMNRSLNINHLLACPNLNWEWGRISFMDNLITLSDIHLNPDLPGCGQIFQPGNKENIFYFYFY